MALLSQEEQHEGRNAIMNICGLMRRFKKEGKITDQDHLLVLVEIKRIGRVFKTPNGN